VTVVKVKPKSAACSIIFLSRRRQSDHVISEMDYNNKVIYADVLVIISLEMYLGKEHKFYQFPNYKQNFENQMPDVVSSFFKTKVASDGDKICCLND
jgi:hypothetical protein